jgi:hypothetical protein
MDASVGALPKDVQDRAADSQTAKEAEVAPSATDRQSDTTGKEHTGASTTWWRDSWHGAADKPYDGEINMLLRWTRAINKSKKGAPVG